MSLFTCHPHIYSPRKAGIFGPLASRLRVVLKKFLLLLNLKVLIHFFKNYHIDLGYNLNFQEKLRFVVFVFLMCELIIFKVLLQLFSINASLLLKVNCALV